LSNWTPKLGSKEFVIKELSRAFRSWEPYSRLQFVQLDDYYKADIRIVFGRYSHGDYYPFDGPGVVLAHAYYPYEFGDFGGDVHFDEDEDWQANATQHSGMDFFTVAVHEIGHALGLSHSPVQESIMYPFYKGPEKSALGYDDILAVYQQYITTPFEDETIPDRSNDEDDNDYDDEHENDKDNDDHDGEDEVSEDFDDDDKDDEVKEEDDDNDNEDIDDDGEIDANKTDDDSDEDRNQDETKDFDEPGVESEDYETWPGSEFDEEYLADSGDYYESSQDKTRQYPTTAATSSSTSPTVYSTTFATATKIALPSSTQTYEGDYESVDDHLRRNREKMADKIKMSLCSPDGRSSRLFDTVARIRGELFVFKDLYMWRYSERGRLRQSYPAPFSQMFGFPEEIRRIDAVIELPEDGNLMFITGGDYWISDGNYLQGASAPLTDLGLPATISRVDAAFVWGKNGKIYIFSGKEYWRLSGSLVPDPQYPKDISAWQGVPSFLDAAFTWTDGVTYFLKGSHFWRFDDQWVKTDSDNPLPTQSYWFGCS